MLCQFSVKNYKSFKDRVTLDLQATRITELENKIINDSEEKEKYLPFSIIYGPNGGGKTNLLSAIYSMIGKVMRPICAACDKKDCSELLKRKEPTYPFRFNSATRIQPTEFEVFFKTQKAEYKYNLSVKDETIVHESLYKRNLHSEKIIKVFIRETNTDKTIYLNRSIFKNISTSSITDTLPLLSYLGIMFREIDTIDDVFKWFEYGIDIINYGNPLNESTISVSKTKKGKDLFIQMLNEMDIDISDYRVEDGKEDYVKIYTTHIVNNKEHELELKHESNGTIKVFGLIPHIIDSILSGSTLIVDELDAKLHPKLLEYIFELYRNPNKNIKGAQLICTSHDLMTMCPELFRRDEIWFVAKNGEQSSQLYSLVEFKKENGKQPRKDEKYGKQYLEGRYGADPYLKRMINWEELYESQER